MPRSRRLTALLATVAMFAAAVPATAVAADPPSQRAYGAFDRGTYVRWVYADSTVTYEHDPEVRYFTTGRWHFSGFSDPASEDFHSFFAFDVDPSDATISKAVLRIGVPAQSYVSNDPSETFALVDVTSTSAAVLAGGPEGTPGLQAIWDDLGNGHQYASRTFTAADNGKTVDIPLDGTATTMLKAGGRFLFGGHLTTTTNTPNKIEQVFQQSGTTSVTLVLTFADPPPPPPAVSKVDAWIRNGSNLVAGYGVVNTTGKNQKLTRSVKKGTSTTYRITLTNFGSKKDAYKVKAAAGTSAYKIVYKQGSKDITAAVKSNGGYITPKVKPGQSLDLTMVVTVRSSAAKGSRIARPVTVVVKGSTSVKDVVQAVVKRSS